MTSRRSLGDFGERVARAHLEAKGYRILETNARTPEGQVDIVAARDGAVAFVEQPRQASRDRAAAAPLGDPRSARAGPVAWAALRRLA